MYQYEVKWWFDSEEKVDRGIVVGKTYAEAMEVLSRNFGEIEIINCSLKALGEDSDILYFKEGVVSIEAFIDA